jgi:hypothetical protein
MQMHLAKSLVLPLGLLVLATAAPASAQYPARPGYAPGYMPDLRERPHFYVGGQLGGFLVLKQVTDQAGYMGQGGGGGVFVGYRFTRYFALELNAAITYHNEQIDRNIIALDALFLVNTSVDAKVYFPSRGRLEAFVQGGIGYGYLGATYGDFACGGFGCDTTFAQGPSFNLGGGFDYWFTPHLTFTGRMLYRGIAFREANYGDIAVRNNNNNFINGIAIDLAAAFHF